MLAAQWHGADFGTIKVLRTKKNAPGGTAECWLEPTTSFPFQSRSPMTLHANQLRFATSISSRRRFGESTSPAPGTTGSRSKRFGRSSSRLPSASPCARFSSRFFDLRLEGTVRLDPGESAGGSDIAPFAVPTAPCISSIAFFSGRCTLSSSAGARRPKDLQFEIWKLRSRWMERANRPTLRPLRLERLWRSHVPAVGVRPVGSSRRAGTGFGERGPWLETEYDGS